MKDERVGKLYITTDLVEGHPEAAAAALAGCVVLRCEHIFHRRRFEYLVWHPDLEPVADGVVPPEYTAELTQHEDGTVTRGKFTRV